MSLLAYFGFSFSRFSRDPQTWWSRGPEEEQRQRQDWLFGRSHHERIVSWGLRYTMTIWNYCDNYELTRISNATLVWFINIPPFAGADSICPRRPNWGASGAWFISIIWMKSFLQPNPHSHMHRLQLQLQSILTCFYYISFIAIHRYVYL